MKRKTLTISIKKIVCFILAIFIIYYGGLKIWAATVETTPITFADNNLYQSLRTRLSKYIVSRDDETKTLDIRTDGMAEITELDLSNCQISDLSGIENFTSLITLNLSKNTKRLRFLIVPLEFKSICPLSSNPIPSSAQVFSKLFLILAT